MGYFALVLILVVCFVITVLVAKKPVLAISFKGQTIRAESFWLVSLVIPAILVAVGVITPLEVLRGIIASESMNPLKILVLFMSMCFISVMLDRAGFFEYCALKAMSRSDRDQLHLFVVFYAVIAVLTVFTSNDIIILTFTPFIYHFAKKAGINPVPYIIAEFVAANTWSLVLMIGNPTNIYIASATGTTFIGYLRVMVLPSIAAGLTSFLMLLLIFRRQLTESLGVSSVHGHCVEKVELKDKTIAALSLVTLGLCVLTLTVGSYIDLEMWLISLVFALLLLIGAWLVNLHRSTDQAKTADTEYQVDITDVFKGLPYSLVPFLFSMFIAVLTLKKHGITDALSRLMFSAANHPWDVGLLFGFASALSSNIINNIPMSILFSGVLHNGATSPHLPVAIYATIIGSNIGAFFSPIGALAGVMLVKILKDKGESFTALTFIKYCAPVAVVSLLASIFVLILVL